MSAGTIPISDLADLCERMAATNRRLFELLGSWVADEPDPPKQRWFAVACHRHAWHAELWSERRPKIPLGEVPALVAADPSDDRADWYAEQISSLRTQLQTIESRVDPILDPSTQRVIQLVTADLAGLTITAPIT